MNARAAALSRRRSWWIRRKCRTIRRPRTRSAPQPTGRHLAFGLA